MGQALSLELLHSCTSGVAFIVLGIPWYVCYLNTSASHPGLSQCTKTITLATNTYMQERVFNSEKGRVSNSI